MSTQFLISSFSFSSGHIVFYFSSNILFLSFIFQLPFCFSYVCFLFLYLVILFILPFHIRTNPNLSFFGIHCHIRTVFYRILFSENHHLTQHIIWYAPFFSVAHRSFCNPSSYYMATRWNKSRNPTQENNYYFFTFYFPF